MSNYKDYLIGAATSGGGAYVPPYEQTWTQVAQTSGYLKSSSYVRSSSPTYQGFHRLATKGLYGGIFDPYVAPSSTGSVIAKAFSVNQSSGAITVHGHTDLWNHSHGEVFSTGQHGGVGHTAMYIGHAMNPSYGATHKGWIYAAEFNTSGSVEQTGYNEAPINMWPHSNGNLVMTTSSTKDSTVYGRRSTYNSNDSKYWHQRGEFTNGSVNYGDYNNPSSNTSTNYAYPFAQSTWNDINPCGYIGYNNGSGVGQFVPIQQNGSRGSALTSASYFGNASIPSEMTGFHLSNGYYFVVNQSNFMWVVFNSGMSPIAGTYTGSTDPVGLTLLGLPSSRTFAQDMYVPLGSDTWLVPNSVLGGFLQINIDVNNNYKVTIQKHYHTLMAGFGLTPGSAGKTYDVTGNSNQYFVYATVEYGRYNITVYNNPFL